MREGIRYADIAILMGFPMIGAFLAISAWSRVVAARLVVFG